MKTKGFTLFWLIFFIVSVVVVTILYNFGFDFGAFFTSLLNVNDAEIGRGSQSA